MKSKHPIAKAFTGCDQCHHWRELDAGRLYTRVGVCRRMPPTAIPFEDDAVADRARHGRALWPRTRENDYCGEYTRKA